MKLKQLINRPLNSINPDGYRFVLLFSLILIFSPAGKAQINSMTDQYLLNPFHLNPAIAGTERYIPVTVSTRQQWMGFVKAPTSKSISFHNVVRNKSVRFTPNGFVNKGERSFGNIGYGATVFSYSYGAISHTGVNLVYAYHVFMGNGRIGFGLAPSIYQFRIDKDGFTLPDGDAFDPLIHNQVRESVTFLDANIGAHYYDDANYAGFALIQFLQSTVQFGNFSFISDDDISLNPDLARTAYLYYGRYFMVNRQLVIEPSAYFKYNGRTGPSFHVNGLVHLFRNFTAGLSYRFDEGFGIIAGAKLDNIEFRYMFEAPFTADVPNNFTSHQLMLRFYAGMPLK